MSWRAVPTARMHLWLMLVLTFTTGINDAIGYLGLDKVFTGNMTGNVVILGMALVGDHEDLPVLGPALALVGFMVGAAIAGRALRTAGAGWNTTTTVLLGFVALIMFVLGGMLLLTGDHPATAAMVTVTTLAALAMGMQAAAARHLAVKDVTTVVVTSTITGLAADSWLGARKPGASARRISAVVLILLGAFVGAAALQLHLASGLLLAGVLIAGVTVVGAAHEHATRAGRRVAVG
ncbi:YoaK family protein [Nocardioides faecalis]|uniref:YoaK family protein n=1 Tax=Nocardioides faecalis TaxID=2803858 RepID=UPI0027DB90C4|nr:YoaK family protein [Nocardioides faecalis]